MNLVELEHEVIRLRSLVNDLASQVSRRRATFVGSAQTAPAIDAQLPVYQMIKPVLLASGDDGDITDSPDWRTVDLSSHIPLKTRLVRVQCQARLTGQSSDNMAQFSVRTAEGSPEQVALWVSGGSGDDTSAVAFADVTVTAMRSFDFGTAGFRLFDPSSTALGVEVAMEPRVGWELYLIGYFA